jgi:hypothetical protein
MGHELKSKTQLGHGLLERGGVYTRGRTSMVVTLNFDVLSDGLTVTLEKHRETIKHEGGKTVGHGSVCVAALAAAFTPHSEVTIFKN